MNFIKTCLKTELALKFKIWFKTYKPAQNHWSLKRISLVSKLLLPLRFLLPTLCILISVYTIGNSLLTSWFKKKKKRKNRDLKYQSGLRVSFIKETNINTPFVCNLIIKRVWKWGVFFRGLCQDIHVTNIEHSGDLRQWVLTPCPWSPALKGQTFPLEISSGLLQKSFLSQVKSQESIFKRAYLVICVLVLKSSDLIERRTSMHPRYCKERKCKSWVRELRWRDDS